MHNVADDVVLTARGHESGVFVQDIDGGRGKGRDGDGAGVDVDGGGDAKGGDGLEGFEGCCSNKLVNPRISGKEAMHILSQTVSASILPRPLAISSHFFPSSKS